MPYITDLEFIAKEATEREDENYSFHSFLKMRDDKVIDRKVHAINERVSAAIDCTQCGNCCKSLVISITPSDAEKTSAHLQISKEAFLEKYAETSQEGECYMNTIPCHFLEGKKCGIYEHRFTDCHDFPHLHKPGFTNRLLNTISFYSMCPIVYNVMEELKQEFHFRY